MVLSESPSLIVALHPLINSDLWRLKQIFNAFYGSLKFFAQNFNGYFYSFVFVFCFCFFVFLFFLFCLFLLLFSLKNSNRQIVMSHEWLFQSLSNNLTATSLFIILSVFLNFPIHSQPSLHVTPNFNLFQTTIHSGCFSLLP